MGAPARAHPPPSPNEEQASVDRTRTPSDHLCLPACLLCPPAGLALFLQALALVNSSGGISAARHLAESEAALARGALAVLPDGPAKTSLNLMVDYVLERIH